MAVAVRAPSRALSLSLISLSLSSLSVVAFAGYKIRGLPLVAVVE